MLSLVEFMKLMQSTAPACRSLESILFSIKISMCPYKLWIIALYRSNSSLFNRLHSTVNAFIGWHFEWLLLFKNRTFFCKSNFSLAAVKLLLLLLLLRLAYRLSLLPLLLLLLSWFLFTNKLFRIKITWHLCCAVNWCDNSLDNSESPFVIWNI